MHKPRIREGLIREVQTVNHQRVPNHEWQFSGRGGVSTCPSVTRKCVLQCRDAKLPKYVRSPVVLPEGETCTRAQVVGNVHTLCTCSTAIWKNTFWCHLKSLPSSSVSVHNVHFMVYAPLINPRRSVIY